MQTWSTLRESQPLASQILKNSFHRNRVSHAYLIQGSRGTGKKSFAILIAMTLFCKDKKGVEPCYHCNICRRITSGNYPDVHWIDPEGSSIRNEHIELLQKEFGYTGFESSKKVYIINQAETLTVNAANRILKFLEEPNLDITALLLTDNGQRILPTIRSRCQLIDLVPLDEIAFQKELLQIDTISISESNARLLSALTNNIDEAIEYHKENKIYDIKNVVEQFIFMLITNNEDRYLFMHQNWLMHFKDKKELEQGLDILLLTIRDIINHQMGRSRSMLLYEPDDALVKRAGQQFTQK